MIFGRKGVANTAQPAVWRRTVAVVPAIVALLFLLEPAFGSMIIAPTFDASITTSPNAAAIESEVSTAIAIYEALFSDPITVSIDFRYAATEPDGTAIPSNDVSRSNYTLYSLPYNAIISALESDAKSPDDLTAIANLPFNALATRIDVTSADGRALGLNTPGLMNSSGAVNTGGTFDGIVTLNTAKDIQFTRAGGIASGAYDGLRFIEHEIDEVLGLGSILPSSTDFTGNSAIRPEDLFRYSSQGNLSLTSSSMASSYFSIDRGATDIAGFNQISTGDYGDWLSPSCSPLPVPLVQYAFSCPGQTADISATSPEAIALDVIGYDLSAPEPGSLSLCGTALFALWIFRARVRKS
jgi:hypothetical protein